MDDFAKPGGGTGTRAPGGNPSAGFLRKSGLHRHLHLVQKLRPSSEELKVAAGIASRHCTIRVAERGSGFADANRPLVPLLGCTGQAHDGDSADKQGAIEEAHVLGAAQGGEGDLWGSSSQPLPPAAPVKEPPASNSPKPTRTAVDKRSSAKPAAPPPVANTPSPAKKENDNAQPEGVPAYKWTRV